MKKEENLNLNEKKATDANIEITQMLDLSDKDFMAFIIKILQQFEHA